MKLFSYVVRYDFGFAPNPFHCICTLATCKPGIRRAATVGDWIIGTGSADYDLTGRVVYAMEVSEILSYDEYWYDQRFLAKRPNLRGSLIQAFGDNIYHRQGPKGWIQMNSRHSFANGQPNPDHIKRDTGARRVLIADEFWYWGGTGPKIPGRFRRWDGHDICQLRSYKYKFPPSMVENFVEWIRSQGEPGFLGDPAGFLSMRG